MLHLLPHFAPMKLVNITRCHGKDSNKDVYPNRGSGWKKHGTLQTTFLCVCGDASRCRPSESKPRPRRQICAGTAITLSHTLSRDSIIGGIAGPSSHESRDIGLSQRANDIPDPRLCSHSCNMFTVVRGCQKYFKSYL